MIEECDIKKIKEVTEEFFLKMTMPASNIEASSSFIKGDLGGQGLGRESKEIVELDIKSEEPQILIGQGGQTLFEIQRLLRIILNKKMNDVFYLNLDINGYKKKKTEYLRNFAKDMANEAVLEKKEKSFSPMMAYERRIVHLELSKRTDVLTESRGEGPNRHIVIKPK